MFLARSRVLAGGIALSLLFAGGFAPAAWTTPAEAEEVDEKLTVPGDIFDRPGQENPCHGREITITSRADNEAEVAHGLIEQCRPALTYEELLYRYTRAAAERDEARRQLQALAAKPPPVAEMPPPPVISQPPVETYPAYSSGSAHPAAPVIYEQDMFVPPRMQPGPPVPIIVQPTPVYVSPPPVVIVAPPRPYPPHYRPPPASFVPAVPFVHRPPPASPPPVVHRPPPMPAMPVVQPPPIVHQPPSVVHRPPSAASPPPVFHRPSPAPAPMVHRQPPAPPSASASRPPAGTVGNPGQDRSTYGK